VTGTAAVTATITILQPGSVQAFNTNSIVADGSDIYEITANGAPRKLWSDKEAVVYALRWTPQGVLAATGNRGRIYRVHENGEFEDLAHLEASQAVGFADAPQGYFVATANSGKLYLLSHAADPEATYESDVFDAGVFSKWGRAEASASSEAFDLFARSGNVESPERNWSEWVKATPNTGSLAIPSARFVQWKAVLRDNVSIASIGLNYLPVNVAPTVDEIVVQTGARVNASAQMQQQPQTVNITFPSTQSNTITFSEGGASSPLQAIRDKSAATVRWEAHDDNGDELTYSVYYRGDGDRDWRLLKDKVTERYYSFDVALLPDGGYRIKVVASDAPSHNPGEALTSDRVSEMRFERGRLHCGAVSAGEAAAGGDRGDHRAISVAGVAAGVASLIIALAITNGMRRDLQERLLGSTAHVLLMRVQDDGIRGLAAAAGAAARAAACDGGGSRGCMSRC
jgi:hypothetical protein